MFLESQCFPGDIISWSTPQSWSRGWAWLWIRSVSSFTNVEMTIRTPCTYHDDDETLYYSDILTITDVWLEASQFEGVEEDEDGGGGAGGEGEEAGEGEHVPPGPGDWHRVPASSSLASVGLVTSWKHWKLIWRISRKKLFHRIFFLLFLGDEMIGFEGLYCTFRYLVLANFANRNKWTEIHGGVESVK